MSAFGVILVRIFPHLNWIRRDTQYRQNTDQNNSKYGHFLRSAFYASKCSRWLWILKVLRKPAWNMSNTWKCISKWTRYFLKFSSYIERVFTTLEKWKTSLSCFYSWTWCCCYYRLRKNNIFLLNCQSW